MKRWLCLFLLCASTAQAASLHELYGGSPPHGIVAADNITRGHGQRWMLLIHGGSWRASGSQYLERGRATWYAARHWATYDIDYRPGELSLVDVIAAYDRLRAQHPAAHICADGASAGAHLALMLALFRPLTCLIGEGAPLNLTADNAILRAAVIPIFGARAWLWSPERYKKFYGGIHTILAWSSFDPILTPQEKPQGCLCLVLQGSTTAKPLPGAPSPGTNFVHASVTPAARRLFDRAVSKMIRHA